MINPHLDSIKTEIVTPNYTFDTETVLVSCAGDIVAPASSMEINGVWFMHPGSASDGSQDSEMGSLTGVVNASVTTFQLAAADSSSSPGGRLIQLLLMEVCRGVLHKCFESPKRARV